MVLYFINDRFLLIGKPRENSITNIQLYPKSPNTLPYHHLVSDAPVNMLSRVNISFEYSIAKRSGGYIFAEPHGNTNNIIFKASPLYKGLGKSSTYFSLTSEGKVNYVKLYILDKTMKKELFSTFISVDYTFLD